MNLISEDLKPIKNEIWRCITGMSFLRARRNNIFNTEPNGTFSDSKLYHSITKDNEDTLKPLFQQNILIMRNQLKKSNVA